MFCIRLCFAGLMKALPLIHLSLKSVLTVLLKSKQMCNLTQTWFYYSYWCLSYHGISQHMFCASQNDHPRFSTTRSFAFQFKYLFGVPWDALRCFLLLFAVETVDNIVDDGVVVIGDVDDVVVVVDVDVSFQDPSSYLAGIMSLKIFLPVTSFVLCHSDGSLLMELYFLMTEERICLKLKPIE